MCWGLCLQRNQWAKWKVRLNICYISLQSRVMVVIQSMVNTLARANQGVFDLVVLGVWSSSCHSVLTLKLSCRRFVLSYTI